jgi:hypothetical protein
VFHLESGAWSLSQSLPLKSVVCASPLYSPVHALLARASRLAQK